MSKWTEIRDSIVDALDVEEVSEELKERVTASILDEAIPAIEPVADKFIEQIKNQAMAESGWVKLRDSVVLPLVIQLGIWLVKTTLSKTVARP